MKKRRLLSKWIILPGIMAAMLAVLTLSFTLASFNDIETSNNNTSLAWTSANWTQTTQADFQAGVSGYVDLLSSGDVQLTRGPFAFRGNATNVTWEYEPLTNSWAVHTAAPGVVGTGNITGGALAYDGGNYVYAFRGGATTFWRYDVLADNWTAMAAAPASIGAGGALAYVNSSSIYAMRGGNSPTFYRYNITSNNWSTNLTAVPANVSAGGALAYDGGNLIYACRGGATSFYAYSISGNSWATLATAPNNLATGNDLAYVPGNSVYAFRAGNTNAFFRYNISTNNWSTMAVTPAAINVGGSMSYDGSNSIYAFRGAGTTTFYRYNISSNNWTTSLTAAPGTVAAGGSLSGMITMGRIASQVLDTTVTGSRWDGLFWDDTLPASTNITFEVRASDTSFLKTDTTLAWTSLGSSGSGTINVISGLPSGRYKQWRATLSTTNVTQTPVLNEVRLYYYGG